MNTLDNQHGCWAGGRNPFGIEARVKQNSGSHNTLDRPGVVFN